VPAIAILGAVLAITSATSARAAGHPHMAARPRVLPRSLGQPLFEPISDGGLGLDQFHFFGNPAFQRWDIFCHER
jgi:hypothetical protein